MRPFAFAAFAALLVSSPVRAQEAPEANLVVTILGGAVIGHSLWTVDKQPLCMLVTDPGTGTKTCSGQYDTLQLGRTIGSSILLGASGTYFPTAHVGFHVELSYLGLPLDSECNGLYFNSDVVNANEQICNNIAGQSASGGAVLMNGGLTLRAASRRVFSPYVRIGIGLVNLPRSTIEVVGAYVDTSGRVFEREIINDVSPRRTSVMFGGGIGFTSPVGRGYQFRLEGRDVVTAIERLTGPADGLGNAPTETRTYHHFVLSLGFDVVLEKKRGRRY